MIFHYWFVMNPDIHCGSGGLFLLLIIIIMMMMILLSNYYEKPRVLEGGTTDKTNFTLQQLVLISFSFFFCLLKFDGNVGWYRPKWLFWYRVFYWFGWIYVGEVDGSCRYWIKLLWSLGLIIIQQFFFFFFKTLVWCISIENEMIRLSLFAV